MRFRQQHSEGKVVEAEHNKELCKTADTRRGLRSFFGRRRTFEGAAENEDTTTSSPAASEQDISSDGVVAKPEKFRHVRITITEEGTGAIVKPVAANEEDDLEDYDSHNTSPTSSTVSQEEDSVDTKHSNYSDSPDRIFDGGVHRHADDDDEDDDISTDPSEASPKSYGAVSATSTLSTQNEDFASSIHKVGSNLSRAASFLYKDAYELFQMKNDTGDVEPEQIEIAVAAKAVDDDLNEPPQYDAATDCQAVLKILPIICTGGCNRSVMDTSMSVSEFQRGRNTFSKKKINAKPLFRSAQASFERRLSVAEKAGIVATAANEDIPIAELRIGPSASSSGNIHKEVQIEADFAKIREKEAALARGHSVLSWQRGQDQSFRRVDKVDDELRSRVANTYRSDRIVLPPSLRDALRSDRRQDVEGEESSDGASKTMASF